MANTFPAPSMQIRHQSVRTVPSDRPVHESSVVSAAHSASEPVASRAGTRLHRRRSAGFTLIELMVVIMILGVLAALVVPNVMSRPDEARVTAAKSDIAQLRQQLKLYRLDNGRYPSSEQGLTALVDKPSAGPVPKNWKRYLDRIPADPWGNPYQYLGATGQGGEPQIISFGADGQQGGEGTDADITE